MTRARLIGPLCILTSLLPVAAMSASAPAGLYNKSIVIFWSEDQENEHTDGKKVHRVVHTNLSIYVSNAGRLFTQQSRDSVNPNGRAVRSSAQSASPQERIKTQTAHYTSAMRFENRTLVSDVKYDSGVRRMTVSFDDAFRNCSVSLLHGKEDSAPGLVRRGMSGQLQLVRSITVSGQRCSVKDGNVFGE